MKVVIIEPFTGYPDDTPDQRSTKAVTYTVAVDKDGKPTGEAIDVPDEFGAMIVKKGHARAADGAPVAEASHEAQ